MTNGFDLHLEPPNSVSRRSFLKFCSGVAVTIGLSPLAGAQIAQAVMSSKKPAVIWLSAQECTGCTESLLRPTHPTFEKLILDLISLDYHETVFAAAGHQAESAKQASMKENFGNYILVVDGSIPTKDGGIYCKVANRTMQEHVIEAAEGWIMLVLGWYSIQRAEPHRGGWRLGNFTGQNRGEPAGLSTQSLQLPQRRVAIFDFWHFAGAGRKKPSQICLWPLDP